MTQHNMFAVRIDHVLLSRKYYTNNGTTQPIRQNRKQNEKTNTKSSLNPTSFISVANFNTQ